MNRNSVAGQQATPALHKLDDIIRKNRDKCSLHRSSRDDIAALANFAVADNRVVKDEIANWRIICLDVAKPESRKSHVLVGDALRAKRVWNTSPLVGIDLVRGIVLTNSGSLYRLVGPEGAGEPPPAHLLHICAMLHGWGSGPYLGVPHIPRK